MFVSLKKRKIVFIAVAFAFLVFALLDLALMTSWFGASGIVLNDDWTAEFEGETKTVDFPHIDIVEDEGTLILSKNIDIENNENLGIVMPFVSGTAFKIYLNEEYIGGVGKLGGSTANIWNSSFCYPLENVKQGENSLKIEIYGLYDLGFHVPPYIEDYDIAARKVYNAGKLRYNLLLLLSGISLAFGIVLIISFIKSKSKNRSVLYAAIIGFLTYFVAADCLFDIGLNSIGQLLLLKKLRFAALFIMLYFIILIIYEAKNTPRKYFIPLISATTVLGFLPIALSGSFYQWYTSMWIIFIFQGINIIIMFYLALSAQRFNVIHIMTCILILLSFSQGLLSNLFNINIPNSLQYSVISISVIIGAMFISQLNNVYKKNQYLEDVSVRDTLTGAFNRRILEKIEGDAEDCVALLDIDNFKCVNDNHGHENGDEVLIDLVCLLEDFFRSRDFIIRLGGDEFCLLLKDCPIKKAKDKLDKLTKEYKIKYESYGIGVSYGLLMFEGSFKKTIKKADVLMYSMKAVHKGADNSKKHALF